MSNSVEHHTILEANPYRRTASSSKNGKMTRFDGVDILLSYEKETWRILELLPPV